MEILAPAGNLEQAMCAIDAGCDALYGGLTKWNARNRAGNFTVDEYNSLIDTCRAKSIKFYLTLNTFLRDDELSEIRKLLNSKAIKYPDAILVADIGLMRVLSREFPEIPLHASTQFGAYTPEDCAFLEQFNVKRAVLARELTLSEIRKLRKTTDMELEVFAYGSQCLCFSGECTWGGVLEGASGNRGRCNGMCRDIYETSEQIAGQLLYPRDIDAADIIGELAEAGVDSVKIEGRRRSPKETEEVIRRFRASMRQGSPLEEQAGITRYAGYLDDIVPVPGMLCTVHERFDWPEVSSPVQSSDRNIVCTEMRPAQSRHGTCTASTGPQRYMATCFRNDTAPIGYGLSVRAVFQDETLQKMIVTDANGNRWSCACNPVSVTPMSVSAFWRELTNKVAVPVSDLQLNVPEESMVSVDLEWVRAIMDGICGECYVNAPEPTLSHVTGFGHNPVCAIQISDADDIEWVLRNGFRKYIFSITSESALREALSCESREARAVYKLPILDFSGKLRSMLSLLKGRNVMISRASQLALAGEWEFASVEADYTLNIWNTEAANILAAYGVSTFAAHPELSASYAADISQRSGLTCSFIGWGRAILGYTRACFSEVGLCSGTCGNNVSSLKNSARGYGIQVHCDNEFGYRRLVHDEPSQNVLNYASHEVRVMLDDATEAEKCQLLNLAPAERPLYGRMYRRNVR